MSSSLSPVTSGGEDENNVTTTAAATTTATTPISNGESNATEDSKDAVRINVKTEEDTRKNMTKSPTPPNKDIPRPQNNSNTLTTTTTASSSLNNNSNSPTTTSVLRGTGGGGAGGGATSKGAINGDEKADMLSANSLGSSSHPERKRKLSTDSLDSCVTKLSADDVKDEEDNEDDEDDEKLVSMQDVDPERLKAFNMFVRLFVDENLDRMTPISKQPKDKVQAILEACDRQFPEFHDRSRKRIRTYLKSCRRLKRAKDANGFDTLRPTPPHLTSAAAESILAQACENESQNAKRMRMGLEPLSAAVMNPHPSSQLILAAAATNNGLLASTTNHSSSNKVSSSSSSNLAAVLTNNNNNNTGSNNNSSSSSSINNNSSINNKSSSDKLASDYLSHLTPSHHAGSFRSPHELPAPFFTANGSSGGGLTSGLFRPFPSSFTSPPAHQQHSTLTGSLASQLQNGPTDLSLKAGSKSLSSSSSSATKNQLNPNEISTIKQLIAGYRESAAFLYASADELEQLLLQQN